MLLAPTLSPVAFSLGAHEVRWYSLAYMAGLLFVRWQLRRGVRAGRLTVSLERLDFFLLGAVLAMYLWGRVIFELVYDSDFALSHPLEVLTPHGGGLSFHGSMIGIGLATWIAAKVWQVPFLALTDEISVAVPFGIGLGRLGNFVNQELWGRVTDVPWGVVFPGAGPEPRHPSQIYESLLEGWLLLAIMQATLRRPLKAGTRTALFLALYALMRFVGEAFRQPDAAIGLALGAFSMGQVLSFALLLIAGAVLLVAQLKH